ncbi:hypothetical protein EVAR_6775_1 [Eumeta japonica]|uniref:Uncharacterized protein n=1 Tax=Eumeta variegata TaxID=151549 RepID=A0A4C1V586_EUMVA|nr:hypothetical protein EVAR_6775_1 [Eumeta japonica]
MHSEQWPRFAGVSRCCIMAPRHAMMRCTSFHYAACRATFNLARRERARCFVASITSAGGSGDAHGAVHTRRAGHLDARCCCFIHITFHQAQ